MISKTVTQTQKFLKLPLEAQALYFHLIQNSDDDGVVEAFPVIRMIGASDDSLGLLMVKDFIRPLNEEMVYFIVDFHEQNSIQKHHYKPSRYQGLLGENEIQGNPRISKDFNIEQRDENIGNQNVNKMLTTGSPNISQYKLSQDNLSQSRSSQKDDDEKSKNPIFEKLKSAFGEMSVNGTMVEEVEDLLETHGQSLVLYALDETILNAGRSIRYTRAILENWRGRGLNTVEQVKENQANYKSATQNQQQSDNFPEVPF